MNRKDLKTLSESYERIFENTIADMQDASPLEGEVSIGIQSPESQESVYGSGSEETKESNMNLTKLRSLIAHANKILQSIEGNKQVQPWMTDKITIASEYMLDVSNYLEFGN